MKTSRLPPQSMSFPALITSSFRHNCGKEIQEEKPQFECTSSKLAQLHRIGQALAFYSVILLVSPAALSATLYVNANNPTPAAPYTDWATAARVIQNAIDLAQAGDTILVTNGTYATGGRLTYPPPFSVTNRVFVTNQVRIQSVNGPAVTVIRGTINPAAPVRCAYLGGGATLSGFTLTNGATITGNVTYEAFGGGVFCASTNENLENCVITGNLTDSWGGGAYQGTLTNCTLTRNSLRSGNEAANGSILNSCMIVSNSVDSCTLSNCSLTGNEGVAAWGCVLNNCTLTSNTGTGAGRSALTNCILSLNAGGAYQCTLSRCTLTGNYGAGARESSLFSCDITGNSGGGAADSSLFNCTVTGNSARTGGGVSGCSLFNSIVYHNTAQVGENYVSGEAFFDHSCTTPLPETGTGNISADPDLAGNFRLSAGSPCRGAGNPSYGTDLDLDGESWANPPSMGCDEYHAGSLAGPLTVGIVAAYTNIAKGFDCRFTGQIEGRVSSSRWDFGDGTVVSNNPYASHAWSTSGVYHVLLQAYNEDYPGGVSATVTVLVVEGLQYVDANSANPVAPYTSWATAATDIQSALDVSAPGALVSVSNGVYATGGKAVFGLMTNRVAVTLPVRIVSVNGPASTLIVGAKAPGTNNGNGAVRCVYLGDGAMISGFTLTNGATLGPTGQQTPEQDSGGGVWCASIRTLVTNCVLIGNSAASGGAAFQSTLRNCTLKGNSAYYDGGGSYYCTLDRCVLVTNSAYSGGGASESTLRDCLVAGNSAYEGGGVFGCDLANCTLVGNLANNGGGSSWGSLTNCILTSNLASNLGGASVYGALCNSTLTTNSATYGGGTTFCSLRNCALIGNSASNCGGGVYGGTLSNCTVIGNYAAVYGGGVASSGDGYNAILTNCIVYYNTASTAENFDATNLLSYCCTIPLPDIGIENITNEPAFVDMASVDLRLQSNSPCINSGRNVSAAGTDLASLPRISGGTVDIGAYEFQSPASAISFAWLIQYGFALDASADTADPDGDLFTNYQEWRAGTDPSDSNSFLRLLPPAVIPPGFLLTWNSDTNHTYFVEQASDLAMPATFKLLQDNILGEAGTTTFRDTSARGVAGFYRVGTDSTIPSNPIWLQPPAFVPATPTLTWTSVTNRSYTLHRGSNATALQAFMPIATNIPGNLGTTSFTDTNAFGFGPWFYRIEVEP